MCGGINCVRSANIKGKGTNSVNIKRKDVSVKLAKLVKEAL
jgi:hypothetical protein